MRDGANMCLPLLGANPETMAIIQRVPSIAGKVKSQKVLVFKRTSAAQPELEPRLLTLRAPPEVKEDLALNASLIWAALRDKNGIADWGVDQDQVVLPGASIPNLGVKRKKGELTNALCLVHC